MLRLKRLYSFILQTFFPVFMMTFVICLFIVLMQFIWKYVEDLVGKGLDNLILGELFFYVSLSLIPLALPLSILLASLMAFGNLGERMELLAIKAAGVSLLKIMRPLIVFIGFVAVGAFFFQDEAMPRINVKSRSLLISIKQKSPELEIPEGSFYSGISNYSLFVKKKNPETKVLYDVMIYNTSEGFDNMAVYVCDSAQMRTSSTKDFLVLNLYDGQQFSNFQQPGMDRNKARDNKFRPYLRENFKKKEVIILFNTDFNRMEESALEGTQISKNIAQLSHSIDSMSTQLDSLNVIDRKTMTEQIYLSYRQNQMPPTANRDVVGQPIEEKKEETTDKINFDSLLSTYKDVDMIRFTSTASSEAENTKNTYLFQSMAKIDLQKKIRYHQIEWHQKFTLSFACLVFFFIGAPLGAIIRKGGLGMPVVVSVLLFIFYYIINNIGYKMARDGVWEVWQGIWLSSFVLFPLGVFLTYKAMNDSALFNTEAYGKFIRAALRIKPKVETNAENEIDVSKIPALSELNTDPEILENLKSLDESRLKDIAKNHQQYGYDQNTLEAVLSILKERGAKFFDIKTKNLDYNDAIEKLNYFLKSSLITLLLYISEIILSIVVVITGWDIIEWTAIILSVAYFIFYIKSLIHYFDYYRAIDRKVKKSQPGILVIAYLFYPVGYFLLKKGMKEDINSIKW
ncbi:LptF/LptG family permease [Dysgonomonas sp. ZJ279]|uniref:LptF/LptG family permease n=1 Tax=Dysgonomonas sp. ZJ279 TaxID=2709796 RepID=UPI0013EB7D3B|nr:LptF/LptG family permease [Dysgonomonas sp. ZJ279]